MKDLNKYTLRFNSEEIERLYVISQYKKIDQSLIALTVIRVALLIMTVVIIILYWTYPAIQNSYKSYFIG